MIYSTIRFSKIITLDSASTLDSATLNQYATRAICLPPSGRRKKEAEVGRRRTGTDRRSSCRAAVHQQNGGHAAGSGRWPPPRQCGGCRGGVGKTSASRMGGDGRGQRGLPSQRVRRPPRMEGRLAVEEKRPDVGEERLQAWGGAASGAAEDGRGWRGLTS